jgi:hypothetical protein
MPIALLLWQSVPLFVQMGKLPCAGAGTLAAPCASRQCDGVHCGVGSCQCLLSSSSSSFKLSLALIKEKASPHTLAMILTNGYVSDSF